MPDPIGSTLPEGHAQLVIDKFLRGRVVPFLGAGVNLCDRPQDFKWESSEQRYFPSGWELARELAHGFHYPDEAQACKAPPDLCLRPNADLDLARVSQYGELTEGPGALAERLHSIFAVGPAATRVHRFLADLPAADFEPTRPENRSLLVVTTNYDELMEETFPAPLKCDVVFYDPDPRNRPSRFWHKKPDGTVTKIVDPATYEYGFFDIRPVVLKIHGTVDRSNAAREGFVITEDHYIEYLAEEALDKLLPKDVLAKLRSNHLLFLGYSLRDWNLRVFLRRVKPRFSAWAVLPSADRVEEPFWRRQEVEMNIIRVTLQTYIEGLEKELAKRGLPPNR